MKIKTKLTAILAVSRAGFIGAGSELPWEWLQRDMENFRAATMNKVCLVGHATYRALPALKGRRLGVLTRNRSSVQVKPGREDVDLVFSSIPSALTCATGEPEVMIIGGAEIYQQMLPLCDRLLLTVVEGTFPKANVHLARPEILTEGLRCLKSETFDPDEHTPRRITLSEWVRE